ncbi:hypothetical protein DH2020_030696 [Rehmannia glutinosa]|uniref:Uncharacterized protein n=1 Tax=Rehmannia glutinosa TaxID=99300 RepID=A0ABR0VLX0_REHGL
MDGRRITASPRPCCGRRVVAKKRPRGGLDGFVNSVKKLQRREISSKRDRAFSMSDAQERFRNIRLQSESLKWPGFVEFDDVNGKVLTYSAQDSPGIMLLILTKTQGGVPLKILSIEDGTVLKSFSHLLHRNKKVDFIEQFNEKLLVKQENENLQIVDVRNTEITEVSRTEFMTPSAFIFLYENQLFLTFRNRTVAVWNFRGELVTSFEDHLLWHPDCNTNNIYITSDQDLIISYCKADSEETISDGNAGSINISNILTGKCLAKIKASNGLPMNECNCSLDCGGRNCNSRKRIKASRIRSTVAEALEDITALFYDEDRNEIYTGNRLGLVHVWNELLRAIDLRLTALRGELTSAFDQAAGSICSVEEMTDIEKFSQYFGSEEFSDSLRKHIELRQGDQAVESLRSKQFTESDRVGSKEGNNHAVKSLSSETQVKYGVSPAKAAQVERQSSTESGESSFSSEKSNHLLNGRTLIRSASPRRSASPMRRVQIGRSGSRRSTAITIKSLNYFPAREKSFFPKDPAANDSDEEGPGQAPKKSESNVRRMSVQDAISLFESKQKDQTGDNQKAKTLLNASIGANKSVLRRWSSGMGEDSSRCPQDTSVEGAEIQNNVENREVRVSSPEPDAEPCGSDVKLELTETGACSPVLIQEEPLPIELTDVNERSNASAEWSRQKEAELNELFTKMMEAKPVQSRTVVPASTKRQSLPSEKRGGFYDHYKEKRDEKLRGDSAKKRTEKDKQFRAAQQILDARKSQLNSANAGEDNKKRKVKKLQKPQKSVSQPANPKTESPRLGIVKKDSPKASSLPATRKSWPSMPSSRATGPSPAKTPVSTSSTGATPTRRRSQPTPVSHSSSKLETSQTRAKPVKSNQNNSKKILRSDTEKKQQSVTKPRKTAISKVQTAPQDLASSTKPSLYSKVTKKSSVVPLESKPFLRKGSKTTSSVNPAVTKKASHPQEPLMKSEDTTPAEENVTVFNSSDPVIHHEEKEVEELKIHTSKESGATEISPQKCEDKEGFSQVNPTADDDIDRLVEREVKGEAEEESTISPRAWVEMEEHEDHPISSVDHNGQVVGSPAYIAPVEVSSPRVRHSLSQMLLEESSEPDFVDWGNAENPPPLVYQKDAPKGFKRLLKFARKNKTEANATGWSSPSVFSEGEDDSDDPKSMSKRSAENLLRKATLHSMNNGHQKNLTDYEHPGMFSCAKA